MQCAGAEPGVPPTLVRSGESPPPGSPGLESTLNPGDRVGRYVVLGVLGHGGMGVVYAAYDPELDRKVAIKLLRAARSEGFMDSEGQARLVREAQAMAKLSHPNVVPVYDVGALEDSVFIAMEFVRGATLDAWLRQAPRTLRQILDVFIAAGRGLEAAHAAGSFTGISNRST